MFQVSLMRPKDFQFATDLANTMDWNMAVEDFEFITNLEPEGCFVAFYGGERVGIATCISFGKVGWFGNLIVKEKYRKKGIGGLLVKRSVGYLQSKGVQTIGLYAYPNLVRFYSDFGFVFDEDFSVLHSDSVGAIDSEMLQHLGVGSIEGIEEFDSCCFGANRKKLLDSILVGSANLHYCVRDGEEVLGYVASTLYKTLAWVGPLICQEGRVDVAVLLLKVMLANLRGKNVYAVAPKKEGVLLELFFSAGFKEDFFVSRMFLGEVVAKNCIYLAESLERG